MGFGNNMYLINNLLALYVKCFGVEVGGKLFDEMWVRDVVSWTGMVSGYVKYGYYSEALGVFEDMWGSGMVVPNEFTFASVLRACSGLEAFKFGCFVQTQIVKLGFEENLVLGSALVDFYSKCGCFDEAMKIFESVKNGDVVTWSTMIGSYVQAKKWSWALGLYLRMIGDGVRPNEFTFVAVLGACCFLGVEYVRLIHAHVVLRGMKMNLVLKTAFVDMYSKCNRVEDAANIFKQTPESDVLLWTAMITGYTNSSNFEGVVATLREMKTSGISPNAFTYAGILNTSSSLTQLELGRQVHSHVIKVGVEGDVSVGNGLVDMYMKCAITVVDALKAFEGIILPNVITWTSLIDGFAQRGLEREAFQVFVEMQGVGVQPNFVTLSGILQSCLTRKSLSQVREIHGFILKAPKEDSEITIWNALVDAYAGLGMLDNAWNVIYMMNHKDVVTYTNLASGINQLGYHDMTLEIIGHMEANNVKIDGFSLASFLSASASLASMKLGKQLHCFSVKSGLQSWISVSNGLVDLYGKCGNIQDARNVFMEIRRPNVVSWNGLISGLASNGHFFAALLRFEDMTIAGIGPDKITFLVLLYACRHGGLVDKGVEYFHSMSETYGISPQFDHYVCLVDLLGRAGRLFEALDVIESIPFSPGSLIFKTLLGSCRVHGNVSIGEDMARRAIELDPSDPVIYILLANIYDDAGRFGHGDLIRQMMRERGLSKNPGQSWMEKRNMVLNG
ncbi:hypothetical protein GIB67_031006 [Kingdonia uniflora]|uniref:Pentatricopeptide repeat-containing protein n=1 Tax=Kingdonia uniflora TaxID=39325 RepID=A0A7J7NGW9_9MAGN|nr:hypothetical protein GIB67_031006 [Kingdonia uniflora]